MDELKMMYEIYNMYLVNPNRRVYTIPGYYVNPCTLSNGEAEMTAWIYRNWLIRQNPK